MIFLMYYLLELGHLLTVILRILKAILPDILPVSLINLTLFNSIFITDVIYRTFQDLAFFCVLSKGHCILLIKLIAC